MLRKARYLLLGGLFLLLDQLIKYYSLHWWSEKKLLSPYLGWYPFQNPGIAFSLPLPNILILLFSFPVLALIIFLTYKSKNARSFFSLVLILAGALSNLADRIVYRFTVDYLLILTGVINLADLMIITGFILYFTTLHKKEEENYVSKT